MRIAPASVTLLLLAALAGCGSGGPGNGGGEAPETFSTCDEIEALIVPELEAQYDEATVEPVDWADVSPLPPGVTPPPADCAWQHTVPAGSSDGDGITAGDAWTVYAFYLRDGSDLIAGFGEQADAAGCFDAGVDDFGEGFCDGANPGGPDGWNVYYAAYSYTVPAEATEIDIHYERAER